MSYQNMSYTETLTLQPAQSEVTQSEVNQMEVAQDKGLSRSRLLFLLCFTQLWESFSFYGMRVLLVLYLVNQLAYSEPQAFTIYALYTSLIELVALIGAYVADRGFGLHRSVLLGGLLICFGHLFLSGAARPELLFGGLGCIIGGSALFKSNLRALVGLVHEEGDVKRESDYTFFYTSINLGGFSAALACGYVAQSYGWSYGLGLAALGMLLGMGLFAYHFAAVQQLERCSRSTLTLSRGDSHEVSAGVSAGARSEERSGARSEERSLSYLTVIGGSIAMCVGFSYLLAQFQLVEPIMPFVTLVSLAALLLNLRRQMPLKALCLLCGLLGALIAFFMIEELMGSLLMLFCEARVDRLLGGVEIPTAALAATNPLVIILAGPCLAYLFRRFPLRLSLRLSLVALLMAFACTLLYQALTSPHPTAVTVIVSFTAIALGELLLVPAVYAICSELSSAQNRGSMMAAVAVAFALASLLSGHLSQFIHGNLYAHVT